MIVVHFRILGSFVRRFEYMLSLQGENRAGDIFIKW